MIQTNQLRIGNILQYKADVMNTMYPEFHWKVTSIGVKSFKCKKHSGINFEPILLTKDIIVKFGFEEWNFGEHCFILKYGNNLSFILFSTNSPVAIANDFEKDKFYYWFNKVVHTIEYLHQLQNIVFFNTDKELTIETNEKIRTH